MTKYLAILITVLCFSTTLFGQKIKFLGVDSSMNNYKGCKWTTTSIDYSTSEEIEKQISIGMLKTETSYYLLNRFAVGGQLFFAMPRGERLVNGQNYNCNTFGGGFAGVLRWEFVQLYHHTLFVETGAGMIFTLKPFPVFGTNHNFTPNYGIGTKLKLTNTTQLKFGYRWQHISNGTGMVAANPSFNGNGIFMGFNFKLNKNEKEN